MNRLLLIGNGFDLANGLRTRFEHFIKDYMCSALNAYNKERSFDGKLLKIIGNYSMNYKITEDNVFKVLENIDSRYPKSIGYKSNLFKSLVKKAGNLEWVDIELDFFDALVELKKRHDKRKKPDLEYNTEVCNLNEALNNIKEELVLYLKKEEVRLKNQKAIVEIEKIFHEEFNENDFSESYRLTGSNPSIVHILNFNYTNTLIKYIAINSSRFLRSTDYHLNYIHGNLDNSNGEPIFGYGDEKNEDYKDFENERNDELFENMKSFGYVKNSNYFNLIGFLEAEEFQVYIMGHSCGLSDREMLNEIFEHKNCRSIKVFYHEAKDGTTDFKSKKYAIYRNFIDKTEFRKKMVPEERCIPLPQYD